MCNTILRLVDTYSLFKNDLQFVVTEWEISMRYETYKYYNKCRIFSIFVSYLFLVFERGIASIFISILVQSNKENWESKSLNINVPKKELIDFRRDLKVDSDSTFTWYGVAGLYTVAYESAWNPEAMCERVTLRHR